MTVLRTVTYMHVLCTCTASVMFWMLGQLVLFKFSVPKWKSFAPKHFSFAHVLVTML